MKKVITIIASSTLAVLALSILATASPSRSAQAATASAQPAPSNSASKEVSYNYVAQPGDSYTRMARKAVQTYGLKKSVKISPAKIIFAETNLTKESGSPYLEIGQKIEIKENAVKNWVDKAQKLTGAQEAAWAAYVPSVNFDTNAVGQAG